MKPFLWGSVALVLGVVSCKRDPGESSRDAVEKAGYEMTSEALFRAAESDDLKALKAMNSGGLELDGRDVNGRTALHAAAGSGALKSVDYLLDQGLEIDIRDKQARTPMMEAVVMSTPEMVCHLLRQGADPRKKDGQSFKPLMLAVRESKPQMVAELAPYVRENLDDALLVGAILGQAAVIDELTNYGASVYARLDDGRTPLMLAAQNGRDEATDMLLAIGANRFGMDESGRTAADLAREAGHMDLAERLAGDPVAGDFELNEPAELGAEMMIAVNEAVVEDSSATVLPWADAGPLAAEEAVEDGSELVEVGEPDEESGNSDEARAPWNAPLSGQGGGTMGNLFARSKMGDRGVVSLEGAVVGDSSPISAVGEPGGLSEGEAGNSTSNPAKPDETIVMRSYREKELPLRVESTVGQSAKLRVSGGKTVRVSEGETIPGSSLQIIHIIRRMESGKDRGGAPVEISVIAVKDSRTGGERELIVGLPALAHDPVALVEDSASGRYYVARTGQRFKSAGGEDFIVGDVRPNQVVIENMTTGETTTLPLRGPRG